MKTTNFDKKMSEFQPDEYTLTVEPIELSFLNFSYCISITFYSYSAA